MHACIACSGWLARHYYVARTAIVRMNHYTCMKLTLPPTQVLGRGSLMYNFLLYKVEGISGRGAQLCYIR